MTRELMRASLSVKKTYLAFFTALYWSSKFTDSSSDSEDEEDVSEDAVESLSLKAFSCLLVSVCWCCGGGGGTAAAIPILAAGVSWIVVGTLRSALNFLWECRLMGPMHGLWCVSWWKNHALHEIDFPSHIVICNRTLGICMIRSMTSTCTQPHLER